MAEHAFQVELVPIGGLEPSERNYNHGDVGAIATAIAVDGWHGSVIARRRRGKPKIVAGEHRWRALALLQADGIDLGNGHRTYGDLLATPGLLLPPVGTCPTQVLSMDELRALRKMVADNRASRLAVTDQEVLASILVELAEADELLGTLYDGDDLDEILADIDNATERPKATDEAPPRPPDPITVRGDLWLLGDHRLLCADATDPASYAQLLDLERAHMLWTDPPYGVNYVGKTQRAMTIINDDLDLDSLERLLAVSLGLALEHTRPGGVWYVTGPGGPEFLAFARVLTDLKVWRQTLVWVKDRFVLGRSDYHHRHEPMFYGWSPGDVPDPLPPAPSPEYEDGHDQVAFGWAPGAAHTKVPDRRQDTVWLIDRPSASLDHPTMKPVALVTRSVQNHLHRGEVILDPFAGSGTTVVVAEQEGCLARALELDPGYCDVICGRWALMTGRDPIREHDGASWTVLAGDRDRLAQ